MLSLLHSNSLKYFPYRSAKFLNPWLNNSVIFKCVTNTKTDVSFFDFDDKEDADNALAIEAEILKKQNKSKLFPPDYNIQNNKIPYNKPQAPFHESLSYRRRLYGKYGQMSNVNPSILWPSKTELAAMKEYEDVLQPFSFNNLVERASQRKKEMEEKNQEYMAQVLEKVKNVKKEIIRFHKEVAKRNREAQELIEKKNQLIEEVRKQFGYKIDVKDEKFQLALLQKKKEEKKLAKAAKKAAKEKLLLKKSTDATNNEDDKTDQE